MSQYDESPWIEDDVVDTTPSEFWNNHNSYSNDSGRGNYGSRNQSRPSDRDSSSYGSRNQSGPSDRDSSRNQSRPSERDQSWRNRTGNSNDDSNSSALSVPERSVGRVIGKGGSKIRELQDQSGARITVCRDNNSKGERDIEIEGDAEACSTARRLIEELLNDDYGGGGSNYSANSGSSFVGQSDSKRTDFSQSQRGCFKCGDTSHMSRDCSNNTGGGNRGRSCFKCGEEGHIGRDCPQAKTLGACFKCGQEGHIGRDCSQGRSTGRTFNNSGSGSYGNNKRDFNFSSQETQQDDSEIIDWGALIENGKLERKKRWAALPAVIKHFYFEDEDVASMHPDEVAAFRKKNNNIFCSTIDPDDDRLFPNPVQTFEQAFSHYPEILDEISKQGFSTPSPIQCQAWPILLQGYDMIGIAQTGTGKTLAFLLPAFIHIDSQPTPREERPGPSCLMLAPTRELAQQIERETRKYEYRGIKCVCVYGGGSRKDQINAVQRGVEIVIATPGRLNDLIMNKFLDCTAVTYLVLDEADRMLDMGFEPQIRKILLDIRPDRQTVMTSATWPEGVRRLAETYMSQPLQVYIGTLDLAAVHSVTQEVCFMEDSEKRDRLYEFLENMAPDEKVIVFCDKKVVADDVASDLVLRGIDCQCIHGDREQSDREQALDDLATGVVQILVATDVASRGLDIKDITHVLNYDFPRNIEEYVHRVGRTGRAGKTGVAISFLTRGDWRQAQHLIDIMVEADQEVPEELISMAERYKAWKQRKDAEEASLGGRGRRDGGRGRGGGRGRRDKHLGDEFYF